MYRVCIYDSKAAEDTLFIKEIIIDERGEVQEISESQNFSDYYARISEQEKKRPDILVTVEPQCAGAAADRADVEDESGSADCLCDG